MAQRERSLNDLLSSNTGNPPRHLLSVAGRSKQNLQFILETAREHARRLENKEPKSSALAGKTVASVFFEDSTRTRLSFESAARKLSADVMSFSAGTSSVKKGESLRDTIQTIEAMGIDSLVVRHSSPGVPWQIANWSKASVINGGDGAHQHPTQALIDAYALTQRLGQNDLDGVRVAIVGDVLHSRVARSTITAFSSLGAFVTLVGPRTLLPSDTTNWSVDTTSDFDEALKKNDVVYMLRIQKERTNGALMSSVNEYVNRFGLTRNRFDSLDPMTLIMHAGPMNRGIEITPAAADSAQSLVTAQVAAGIPVRMAVLELCMRGAINNE